MPTPNVSRREFILRSGLAGLGGLALAGWPGVPARAIEPFRRAGQSRLELSLAAFSFRLEYQNARPWEDVPRWLGRMKAAFAA